MAVTTQSMRDFCTTATSRRPFQYSEPSLKGVPAPAGTKLQGEPALGPSLGGCGSTQSLSTATACEPPSRHDHTWQARLDGLRNDLAATRLDLDGGMTKQERVRFLDRIMTLEGDVHKLQQEAEQWRSRCLESERDRAAAAASEDRAQLELRDACARERHLAQQSVEFRLQKVEMEHSMAYNEFEVQKHQRELLKRDEALRAKDEEIKSLKDELLNVRGVLQSEATLLREKTVEFEATSSELRRLHETCERQRELLEKAEATRHELKEAIKFGESRRLALERAEYEHQEQLERERQGRLAALSEAKQHSDGLVARVRDLESELGRAHQKHADATREAECFRTKSEHLDEVNKKLRLDLQESIGHGVRSGGVPFYHDGPSHAIAGAEDRELLGPRPPNLDTAVPRPPGQAPTSPSARLTSLSLSPAMGRLDYPRSSCSRRLRKEVLTARTTGRHDEQLPTPSWGNYSYAM